MFSSHCWHQAETFQAKIWTPQTKKHQILLHPTHFRSPSPTLLLPLGFTEGPFTVLDYIEIFSKISIKVCFFRWAFWESKHARAHNSQNKPSHGVKPRNLVLRGPISVICNARFSFWGGGDLEMSTNRESLGPMKNDLTTPPTLIPPFWGPIHWIGYGKLVGSYSSFLRVCSVDLEREDKKQSGCFDPKKRCCLFVHLSRTRGPLPLRQSFLECPGSLLVAVKLAWKEDSSCLTALERARWCFGTEKMKRNSAVIAEIFDPEIQNWVGIR